MHVSRGAASRAGASHVFDLRKEGSLAALGSFCKDKTKGRGIDVVYDPVGGELFEASLRATAFGGESPQRACSSLRSLLQYQPSHLSISLSSSLSLFFIFYFFLSLSHTHTITSFLSPSSCGRVCVWHEANAALQLCADQRLDCHGLQVSKSLPLHLPPPPSLSLSLSLSYLPTMTMSVQSPANQIKY